MRRNSTTAARVWDRPEERSDGEEDEGEREVPPEIAKISAIRAGMCRSCTARLRREGAVARLV